MFWFAWLVFAFFIVFHECILDVGQEKFSYIADIKPVPWNKMGIGSRITTASNSDTKPVFHHTKCWIKHIKHSTMGKDRTQGLKNYTKQISPQISPSSCWLTAYNLQKFKVYQFKWIIMMKAVLNCGPSPAFEVIFVTPSFCQAHVTEKCA